MNVKVDCGAGFGSIDHCRPDGVLLGRFGGLLMAGNTPRIRSALLGEVSAVASGVIYDVRPAVIALPPIRATHYDGLPLEERLLPVAIIAGPEQMHYYGDIHATAANSGVTRRVFLCADEANVWMEREARLWEQTRQYLRQLRRRATA